nr:hypothetical protein Iba_chr06aCG16480 [Ipomoea batatas]
MCHSGETRNLHVLVRFRLRVSDPQEQGTRSDTIGVAERRSHGQPFVVLATPRFVCGAQSGVRTAKALGVGREAGGDSLNAVWERRWPNFPCEHRVLVLSMQDHPPGLHSGVAETTVIIPVLRDVSNRITHRSSLRPVLDSGMRVLSAAGEERDAITVESIGDCDDLKDARRADLSTVARERSAEFSDSCGQRTDEAQISSSRTAEFLFSLPRTWSVVAVETLEYGQESVGGDRCSRLIYRSVAVSRSVHGIRRAKFGHVSQLIFGTLQLRGRLDLE